MNLLLDTHAFIWCSVTPKRLSATAAEAIRNSENPIYISQVSTWEMQIKSSIGKLRLPVPAKELVESSLQQNEFSLLEIKNDHFWHLENLPHNHKDPFDRLLISQAQCEEFVLVTVDERIHKYDLKTLW